jgi:hypothetical protein
MGKTYKDKSKFNGLAYAQAIGRFRSDGAEGSAKGAKGYSRKGRGAKDWKK